MLTLDDNACPKNIAKNRDTNRDKNTDFDELALHEVVANSLDSLDIAELETTTPLYDPETQRALNLFVVLMRCSGSVGEQARKDIAPLPVEHQRVRGAGVALP